MWPLQVSVINSNIFASSNTEVWRVPSFRALENTKCGLLAKTLRQAHEQNVEIPNVSQKGQFRRQKTKDVTRCLSVQFRLLSLALCRSLSRWAWLACRLLSGFLCLSLSLYSKLEDKMNENSRKYECKNNFCQLIQKKKKKNLFVLSWLRWTSKLFKPCFHMIVRIFRIVPVVSKHVQTIGTIIWKPGFMLDKTQWAFVLAP